MSEVDEKQAIKLLQGYIWHPREMPIDLEKYLPRTLEPALSLLWDAMPRAPFTFFDDGTLSATQQFYQFTVLSLREDREEASQLIPYLAEILQTKLNATPPGVGWQIFEDLREV